MKIKVIVEEDHPMLGLMEQVLEQGAEHEHLPFEAEISVSFVSNEEIRQINFEQRGIDQVTDVLSFPMLDCQPGEEISFGPEDQNPETGRVYLGDIVISIQRAGEQAQEYGHSLEREISFLTIHSFLHLLGYDHMTELDQPIMRLHEEAVLNALGLTREE